MFDKEKEMLKVLKPLIQDMNQYLAPQLIVAFNAGYEQGKKSVEDKK